MLLRNSCGKTSNAYQKNDQTKISTRCFHLFIQHIDCSTFATEEYYLANYLIPRNASENFSGDS